SEIPQMPQGETEIGWWPVSHRPISVCAVWEDYLRLGGGVPVGMDVVVVETGSLAGNVSSRPSSSCSSSSAWSPRSRAERVVSDLWVPSSGLCLFAAVMIEPSIYLLFLSRKNGPARVLFLALKNDRRGAGVIIRAGRSCRCKAVSRRNQNCRACVCPRHSCQRGEVGNGVRITVQS